MPRRVAAAALLVVTIVFLPRHADAASALSVEAVSVSPATPGPNSLCTLNVRLKNAGSKTATNFRFKVTIDGQEVTTYRIETYAVDIAPGVSGTVALHNFWTAAAPRASSTVEVSVVEASWAEVKREANASTTTPADPVGGLPVTATQTITMSAK